MKIAEGIRKHGFRKWYERQLLQSHAHLTLTIFCGLGVFGAVESAMRFRSWNDQLMDVMAVLLCTGVGIWALRRYLFLLAHAEAAANQADCSNCSTYGRLELLHVELGGELLRVRCRKCGHAWPMRF